MIEGYLLERENLRTILVLVDGEIGPTKLDVAMLDWLEAHDAPFVVIATKLDKVKPSKRGQRKRDLADACEVELDEVIWVSAAANMGIDELRDMVRGWLSEHSGDRPSSGPKPGMATPADRGDQGDQGDAQSGPKMSKKAAKRAAQAALANPDDDDDDDDWEPSRVAGDGT